MNHAEKYEKPPITYLKVLEHHGFCKPKICSWPSFTKSFSVANSYAVCTATSQRDTPIDVSLVFCIYTVKTSTILSTPNDKFWEAIDGLNYENYCFRGCGYSLTDTIYESWRDVENFAFNSLPGGVYISNYSYLRLANFRCEIISHTPSTEKWWTDNSTSSIIFGMGCN